MAKLDARRHAYREDLADERLKGAVNAQSFVSGETRFVCVPVADVRRRPGKDCGLDTQFLLGETVQVFDEAVGADGAMWAWCQSEQDGYVGYLPSDALAPKQSQLTHRVAASRTFVFPTTDLKQPPLGELAMGAKLAIIDQVELRGTDYAVCPDGSAVPAHHVVSIDEFSEDFVEVASRYVGTPYLWGGASAFGIDCSGLVQRSLAECGVAVPRDSDMQEAEIGSLVRGDINSIALKRGDLLFWPGHVGLMADADTLLHANAYHMATALEPVRETLARFAAKELQVSAVRRL